jgi:uncharacterized membrane protein YkvA (DUF1232 family)
MGDHTGLTIVLGFIALLLLIAVGLFAVMIFVIFRYRVPLRGIAAMVGALVYLISPVDALPEAVLGPFGLVDDVGVLGAVGIFVYRLIQAQQAKKLNSPEVRK